MKLIFIIILLLPLCVRSQVLTRDDSIARKIPNRITNNAESFAKYLKEEFKTNDRIVRALYVWLGYNVSYEVSKLDDIMKPTKHKKDEVNITLRSKRGICQDYSDVFTRICNLDSIEAFTIMGYARIKGKIENRYGHSWNVAKVDSNWEQYDPTWGAGYVNDGRFYKKFNFTYYKSEPDSFIKTHMPCDPIWELLDYPVTNKEFIDGKIKGKKFMNYKDSIEKYLKEDTTERMTGSLRRAEENGIDNPKLREIAKKYKMECEYYIKNKNIKLYNDAIAELNIAINNWNKYNEYKHRRGEKITKRLNEYFSNTKEHLSKSKGYLNNIETNTVSKNLMDKINQKIKQLEKAMVLN